MELKDGTLLSAYAVDEDTVLKVQKVPWAGGGAPGPVPAPVGAGAGF